VKSDYTILKNHLTNDGTLYPMVGLSKNDKLVLKNESLELEIINLHRQWHSVLFLQMRPLKFGTPTTYKTKTASFEGV